MTKRRRPQILADQFMQSTVLAMIAAGASRAAAARFVGIHVQTLRRRMRTDRTFAQRFLEAKAHAHGSQFRAPSAGRPSSDALSSDA